LVEWQQTIRQARANESLKWWHVLSVLLLFFCGGELLGNWQFSVMNKQHHDIQDRCHQERGVWK
jgi:hypothetical protein